MSERWRERERGREREREGQGGTERDREGQRGTERDREGQRGTERDREGEPGSRGLAEEREGERYFLGRIGDVFNIRGNSGYFCCPPNTPKIWGTPDCGPTSIEFQREQFQNATNNFLGSGTCVFINWGTFINRN